MPSRIAILGASGAVGTASAAQILRARLLDPGDQLLLVGRGVLATERRLRSLRVDLQDAFDDQRISIEVVPTLREVEADIVVVAVGTPPSPQVRSRRDLGASNHLIFQRIADQCTVRLSGAFFIVVSNPVELAVRIFSSALGRRRVIGMGAQQDSLRFARAVAADLGITRRHVRASVAGEHGPCMVPLWPSVELTTQNLRLAEKLEALRARSTASPLQGRVAQLLAEVNQLVLQDRIAEGYELTRRALPDARIFVEPQITFHCLRSTPNATANAVVEILAALLANDRRRVHGQVELKGEVLGLHGVCGIPLRLAHDGWQAESLDWLGSEEIRLLERATDSIEQSISAILGRSAGSCLSPEATMQVARDVHGCHRDRNGSTSPS